MQAGVGAREQRVCQLAGGGEQVDDGAERERSGRCHLPLGMSSPQDHPVPSKAHISPWPWHKRALGGLNGEPALVQAKWSLCPWAQIQDKDQTSGGDFFRVEILQILWWGEGEAAFKHRGGSAQRKCGAAFAVKENIPKQFLSSSESSPAPMERIDILVPEWQDFFNNEQNENVIVGDKNLIHWRQEREI